jgi:cobalt/nickel transport system permease protein
MKLHLLEHRHGWANSPIHRLPAELKLGAGLALITATVLLPATATEWYLCAGGILALVALLSRISPWFLLKRLLLLAPLVLGVTLVNAFQPAQRAHWPWLLARSALCLLTVILVSNTTPFSEVLRVLRRIRVPALLITTIALMHRYLFVLAEEAERMRRARASRTFTARHRWQWPVLATVAGQLFIRASERAERIYAAMCARGLK